MSLAHDAHPPAEDHDDTVEAHYASLELPHACNDGWITLGQIVVDPETGEETEEFALYLCRRCTDSPCSYHQRGHRRVEYSRRLDDILGE